MTFDEFMEKFFWAVIGSCVAVVFCMALLAGTGTAIVAGICVGGGLTVWFFTRKGGNNATIGDMNINVGAPNVELNASPNISNPISLDTKTQQAGLPDFTDKPPVMLPNQHTFDAIETPQEAPSLPEPNKEIEPPGDDFAKYMLEQHGLGETDFEHVKEEPFDDDEDLPEGPMTTL